MEIEYTLSELTNIIGKHNNLEDGNYEVIIRTTDGTKNKEAKYLFKFRRIKNGN